MTSQAKTPEFVQLTLNIPGFDFTSPAPQNSAGSVASGRTTTAANLNIKPVA